MNKFVIIYQLQEADWNGVSLIKLANTDTPADVTIQTDASGSWCCGAFFNNKWFTWKWPQECQPVNIMAKEMAPILLSCGLRGPHLSKLRVKFECDNSSVSKKDQLKMKLPCIFEMPVVFLSHTMILILLCACNRNYYLYSKPPF